MINKIKQYFEDRCWFIFHEWEKTNEHPGLTPSSENYYWIVEKCKNCPAKRIIMNTPWLWEKKS